MKLALPRLSRWTLWVALLICGPALMGSDSPPSAARPAELEAAWWNLSVGDFDGSEKIFLKLAQENPSTRVKAEAWFALGESAGSRPGSNIAEARKDYQQCIATEPNGPFAAWALLAEARLIELDVNTLDLDGSLAIYQRILREYPAQKDVCDEATLRIAANQMKRIDRQHVLQGIETAEKWLSQNKESPLAPTALNIIASVQIYPLADYEAALKTLLRRCEYPVTQDITGAGVYFTLANIAHHKLATPNLELAAQYYRKLLKEMPWDDRITQCHRALKEITGKENGQ